MTKDEETSREWSRAIKALGRAVRGSPERPTVDFFLYFAWGLISFTLVYFAWQVLRVVFR